MKDISFYWSGDSVYYKNFHFPQWNTRKYADTMLSKFDCSFRISGKTRIKCISVQHEALPVYIGRLDQERYLGRFQFEGEWMTIYRGKNCLMMDSQYMGKFYLDQFSESLFRLRDQENFINFMFDPH